MKKILIEENAELANKHIQQVETEYIKRVGILASAIAGLGIGVPTKEQIIDAISNNSNNIQSVYDQSNNLEKEDSKTAQMLAVVFGGESNKRMDNVRKSAEIFNNNYLGLFNGLRLNDPKLFDWFDVSDDGKVLLVESVKDSIRESVKVYTATTAGANMYALQQSLVNDMQKMYDMMVAVHESDGSQLSISAQNALSLFPRGLFETSKDPNTDRLVFKAKSINFDPETTVD
ncbi:MAG: hypothetical protein PHH37_04230 [Paludibacter sp.]|nr:hypothetical protein [Paludibacter sp.]